MRICKACGSVSGENSNCYECSQASSAVQEDANGWSLSRDEPISEVLKPKRVLNTEQPEKQKAGPSDDQLTKALKKLIELQAIQNAHAKKAADAAQGILSFMILSAIGAFGLWFFVAVILPTL